MVIKVYGLKRCSTCVKAQKWLHNADLAFTFYDVREEVPSAQQLTVWGKQIGWDKLINKTSQTWRALADNDKQGSGEQHLVDLLQKHLALMKRPLLECDGAILLGYSESKYQEFFKSKQ